MSGGKPSCQRFLFVGLVALLVAVVPFVVHGLAVVATAHTRPTVSSAHQEFLVRLIAAARDRPNHPVRYDGTYVRIPYPGGDVPEDTGVCTDEIIRSYRAVGVDLQKEVHEDMVRDFAAYPSKRLWGLAHADSNVDHRRVPNLMVFFSRHGESLPTTAMAEDYASGDLVTWDLGGNVPHIGIVVDRVAGSGRPADRSQHWFWAKDGGCFVSMEDYRALSVLRARRVVSKCSVTLF